MAERSDLAVNQERLAEFMRRGLEGFVGRPLTKDGARVAREFIESMLRDGFEGSIEPEWDIEALPDPENKDIITIRIGAKNAEAERMLAHALLHRTGIIKKPDFIFEFEITEEAMEKNGNTFSPGARVQMPKKPGEKNAESPRTGVVTGDVTDDGKMKVAWDEGAESWEDPGTLRNKT